MAEDLEEDFDDPDSPEEVDSAPARSGGGGGKGNRKLILILLPILLLLGSVAGAYFLGLLDPIFHKKKEAPIEDVSKPQEVQVATFDDLPEMLVNLNTVGRKQSFLKIKVTLELESPLDQPKVDAMMPRIVDNFQVYLRELRLEDLQGSAGMLRLREELLARVNSAVKPVKVDDVLFKEMLVQ